MLFAGWLGSFSLFGSVDVSEGSLLFLGLFPINRRILRVSRRNFWSLPPLLIKQRSFYSYPPCIYLGTGFILPPFSRFSKYVPARVDP